jgi:hypothetical protein
MPIILACAALAVIVMRLAPHSAAGLVLRRLLVEAPARWLSGLRRAHVILVILSLLALWAAVAIARTEGAPLVAQGMPEAMTWILSLDVASYMDAVAIAFLLAAGVRVKALKTVARAAIDRVLRRPVRAARPRRRRPQRARAPANDDEPAPRKVAA